jgi:hypothetical protein
VRLETIGHTRHPLQLTDHFLLQVGHPRRLTGQRALQRGDLGFQAGQPFLVAITRNRRVRAGFLARHRDIVSRPKTRPPWDTREWRRADERVPAGVKCVVPDASLVARGRGAFLGL